MCVKVVNIVFQFAYQVANYRDIQLNLEFNEALYIQNAVIDLDVDTGRFSLFYYISCFVLCV